jgi:GntR family transcriptional regulator/MocR family aminotransferase
MMRSIVIDRHASVPVSDQLFEGIRASIRDGALTPGEPLPSTRELARYFDLSRNTVLAAYSELLMHGLIETRVGYGTTVAEPAHSQWPATGKAKRFRAAARPVVDRAPALPWTMQPKPPRWLARAQMNAIRDIGRMNIASISAECLEAVTHHLALRGIECGPAEIAIVTNRRHALYAIARSLAAEGGLVWFEEPGDDEARSALAAGGLAAQPLPVDQLGANIARVSGARQEPRVTYTTPANHVPLGITMNARRRRMLREWAFRNEGFIVADESSGFLRWPVPPPLFARQSRVIHVESIAPVFEPYTTLACVAGPEEIIGRIRTYAMAAGATPPLLEQRLVTRLLTTGTLQRERRKLRLRAKKRDAAIVDAARAHLSWCVAQITGTEAGDRATLWLHQEHCAQALAGALAAANFACSPVHDHALIVDLRRVSDAGIDRHFEAIAAASRALLAGARLTGRRSP